MSVLKVSSLHPNISKYFLNVVEETVNYREKNKITRNDFMQLLIQMKNKVILEEDNVSLEQNVLGALENSSIAESMYTVISCTYIYVLFAIPFI